MEFLPVVVLAVIVGLGGVASQTCDCGSRAPSRREVCGTDNVIYPNLCAFNQEQQVNQGLGLLNMGPCRPAGSQNQSAGFFAAVCNGSSPLQPDGGSIDRRPPPGQYFQSQLSQGRPQQQQQQAGSFGAQQQGPQNGFPGGPGGFSGSQGGYPGSPGRFSGGPGGFPGSQGRFPGGSGGSPFPGSQGGLPGGPGGRPGGQGGFPGGFGGRPGGQGGFPGGFGGRPGGQGGFPGGAGGRPGGPGGYPGSQGGYPGGPGGSDGRFCLTNGVTVNSTLAVKCAMSAPNVTGVVVGLRCLGECSVCAAAPRCPVGANPQIPTAPNDITLAPGATEPPAIPDFAVFSRIFQ